ncbi:unknown [Bacteroides sp. CAG:754]|nr:unknown [Bacteroides sp. CAG:754]
MFSKRFRENDIIEHLNNENTTLVRFFRKEREHLLIFLECFLVHFQCKRIIFQFHQRRKRVSVPEIQGIHTVGNQHIQVFNPLFLIIEPRETLGRIGIFINTVSRQISHFLQTDTSTTKHHFRPVLQFFRKVQFAFRIVHTVYQFTASVDYAATVPAGDFSKITSSRYMKTLFLQSGIIHFRQQNCLYFRIGECGVSLLHHYLIACFIQGSL